MIFLIPTFFSWIIILALSMAMFVESSKTFSDLFRIRSTYFWLFMIKINMLYYVFKIIFLLCHKIFRITDRHILCCDNAFILWMEELFTVFIHTNITIMCFFFLFKRSKIIFLALVTIRNQNWLILFSFFLVYTCCVDTLPFLSIHQSHFILIFSVHLADCFFDAFCSVNVQFNSFGMYPNMPLGFN